MTLPCIAGRRSVGRDCLLVALLIFAQAGCGGDTADPERAYFRGRITNEGEPLYVEGFAVGIGAVRVAFHPVTDGKVSPTPFIETGADPDGYFEIRDGLPPGQYHVVVEQWDPHPDVEKLKGRFSAGRSPILETIAPDQQMLEIDLADYQDEEK